MPSRPILFVLAHAAGNAIQYQHLFPELKKRVDLVPLDLPGHGERVREPLLDNIPAMRRDVERMMTAVLDRRPGAPYALFGHSLGSLLGYLAAIDGAARGRGPAHLFVSSGALPGRHYVPEGFTRLSDDDLWQESARYFGGMSKDVLECAELKTFFLPLLKADLSAVIQYDPGPLQALEVPVTAFYGQRDIVDEDDMLLWRRLCAASFACHCLDGDHFHPFQSAPALERIIGQALAGLMPAVR